MRKVCAWKKKERKNNAKFGGHYVRQCRHNVCAHTLCSDKLYLYCIFTNIKFYRWTHLFPFSCQGHILFIVSVHRSSFHCWHDQISKKSLKIVQQCLLECTSLIYKFLQRKLQTFTFSATSPCMPLWMDGIPVKPSTFAYCVIMLGAANRLYIAAGQLNKSTICIHLLKSYSTLFCTYSRRDNRANIVTPYSKFRVWPCSDLLVLKLIFIYIKLILIHCFPIILLFRLWQ